MSRPVIVSCALTGGADTKGINPAVPVTPEELAADAIAVYNAGAAIAHIHVRDPETAKESPDPELNKRLFHETVNLIRKENCPIILNLTTGWGAFLFFDEENPEKISNHYLYSPMERVAHILECEPDICSLDIATFNFANWAMVNTTAMVKSMAELVQSVGAKPEIEVFDTGHIRLTKHLIETGVLKDPHPLFQLCLGIPWGAGADPDTMQLMRNMLPENALWSAFGISKTEFPTVASAVTMGGNVRVGLEDNLYISHGELASGNVALVERAAQIIENLGEKVASVHEARKILYL